MKHASVSYLLTYNLITKLARQSLTNLVLTRILFKTSYIT